MNSVVIAETDNDVVSTLIGILGSAGFETARALSVASALGTAERDGFDVVIVGPSLADDGTLALVDRLRANSSAAVILMPQELDTDLMRRALRAGVHDMIPVGSSAAEIVETVSAAMKVVEETRGESARLIPVATPDEPELARVVTVFSTKGGVGKTVISTNLAVSLCQAGNRVILVDLDLQFGDVGIMMGLEPDHTVFDAVQNYERLDTAMLQGLLISHDTGLRALLAPIHPEDAEAVTATRISGIIALLRQMADYVVIDTAPGFNDVTLAALDETDVVYVVTMMDIASIKNTRISIQKLAQLGYRRGVLRLVLNRADSKVFLSVGDVESAVGARVISRIPSDLVVPRSVNRGVPVVLDAPRSKVAKSLMELADDATRAEERGEVHVA